MISLREEIKKKLLLGKNKDILEVYAPLRQQILDNMDQKSQDYIKYELE